MRQRHKPDTMLNDALRDHLYRYAEKYRNLTEKEKDDLDLLEYKITTRSGEKNLIIDRNLLGDYLTLKLAKSTYWLQWIIVAFTVVLAVSSIIQVLNIFKLIP